MLPTVCCITCTKNRFTLVSRLVGMFIQQDYQGEHMLIVFNNADTPFILADITLPPNKQILVVNQNKSFRTGEKYTNLGQIYNDSLEYVPDRVDVLNFMDDDDIFLPNHISEGIKGLSSIDTHVFTAYKPQFSYFWASHGISLENNVLEPSIFVLAPVVLRAKFRETNVDLHHEWISHAIVYANKEGVPTFCYDWSGKFPCFKTSGDGRNPQNFSNYDKSSTDSGNGVLVPWDREHLDYFYKQFQTL